MSLGQNIKRLDAYSKVTGEAPYPGDVDLEGQLWMKLRFSDRAHAKVLRVDSDAARALPGVIAVYTAADVPVNRYGLVTRDQPVLCGPGSTIDGADVVRCYADCVAAVVAESEAIAAAAVKLIQVTYEDLPAVFDPEAAMREDAPQIQATHPNNILCHYRIRHGDLAAGWEQADVIVEATYTTGYQEHAYLQPEAGLGYLDDQGRVTVLVAGQWVHEDQDQIAHALGLPDERVRVIYPAVGGAFGGREDMSVQIVLALAVWKLERPVKIIWSREESILFHHKRHPISIWARWGATNAGKLVAAQMRVVGDAGPYNYTSSKVMANANLMVAGPYVIPNCHIDTYGVLTNNIPTGAFRGFGAPQAAFAAESQMNKLAEALRMDVVELRLLNCIQEGSIISVGTPMPKGVTMSQVIEQCAVQSEYWLKHTMPDHPAFWSRMRFDEEEQTPALRRGLGFACGFKNIGYSFGFPEQSWATIELHGDVDIESVIVRAAGAEVGQGAHTVIPQMAAAAVGVPVSKVRLIGHDTAETQNSGSSSASRMTFMSGNAVRGAAELALRAWQNEERPAVGTFQYRPPRTTMYDPQTGVAEPNFAYGYVAQIVELVVDIETGHIHLERVVSAHDVGRVVNEDLVVGQIEGGIVQGQGYALMEHLVSHNGRILNPHLSTYLIPTVLDVPTEIQSIILEYADPIGPWGVRGMAEMPLIPLAPAIVAAVHDATGVWIDEIPMTPDLVVAKLREQGVGILS